MKRVMTLAVLLISICSFAQESGFSKEEKQNLLEILHKFERWQNPDGKPGTLTIYPRFVINTNTAAVGTDANSESESDTQTGIAIDVFIPFSNSATIAVSYLSLSQSEEIEQLQYRWNQKLFQAGLKIHIK